MDARVHASRLEGSSRVTILILVMISLMLSGYSLLSSVPTASAQTLTFPSGIVAYAPITIMNTQLTPTPAPFQQMVQVNSITYSTHEASNLQNVEFFDSTGAVIPSWLESGASSSSTNTIYWLKIEGGIPAESSVTVYMGFTSPTTNLFNAQTTGEAPALSPSYGEYDDGGSVFTYEWNFAGPSLPSGWAFSQANSSSPDNGGYGVSNGASFYTGQCGAYVQSCANAVYGYFATALDSGSYVISAEMQSFASGNNGRVWFGGNNGQGVWFGWWSEPQFPTTAGAENGTRPYNGDYVSDFIWCNYGDCVQPFEVTGNGGSTQTANSYDATRYMIYSLSWQGDNQVGTLIPPSGTPITVSQASSSPSGGSYYLGFWDFTKGMGDNGETAQWVTVSAMPPNGVMPSATLGVVIPTTVTKVACSSSSIDVGSFAVCTATVTGNSPTGTVTWSTSGVGTFSSSYFTCNLSAGVCSIAYEPAFSTPSNVTITASYGGDANNEGSLGTFSLGVSKSTTSIVISCSPSPVTQNSFSTCAAVVTGYTPGGFVTFTSTSSSGVFSPSNGQCALSSGSCLVRFSDTTGGNPTITASYAGDSNNLGGSGTFSLVVSSSQYSTLYLVVAILVVIIVGLVGLVLFSRKKSG